MLKKKKKIIKLKKIRYDNINAYAEIHLNFSFTKFNFLID